jgi:tetratricopeptide (TPR) repeat protein
MGVVLAAYDPELDRKAALKLLKHSADRPKARMRLRREAQALAKLNHANVLTVYDVGVHDGQVFLAMEFVEGRTLFEWMRAEPGSSRSWREVVAVFVAAGRGLAAVHEVGLVHRDFKPDNVMIGDDGRVRVADFGLARLTDGSEPGAEPGAEPIPEPHTPLQTRLTRVGVSLGTPAYMAPEQFLGEDATVHSDQFGFCVALFEALYGVLPYPGKSIEALTADVTHGRVIDPPARGIPSWLTRVVLRGLARDPGQRFASMTELLAALNSGAVRRRRAMAFAAVAGLGLLVAGGLGLHERELDRREADCRAFGATIDQIWNDRTRTALRDGLLATEVGHAATVADKLMPWLDRQAQTWREQATYACMNAKIDGRWDAATYDKVGWCLEHHKVELEILVSELAVANRHTLDAAVIAAGKLSLIEACTSETSLATLEDPPDAELRPEFAAIHHELMRATILEHAGDFEAGLGVTRAALARAEALGWKPLTAAVRGHEALLLADIGAFDEAEAVGDAAYIEAAASGTWDIAATVASRQAIVVGLDKGRPVEGKAWVLRDAVVAIAHAGDPFGLREALRLSALAVIQWNDGELEQSKRLQEQVLAIQVRVRGPDHPNVASTLINIGATHSALGHYQQALQLYEQALVMLEQALGPEHPQLADCLNNIGYVQALMNDHEAAQHNYERALELDLRAVGPEHPKYADTLGNLAVTHAALGDLVQAEALLRQVLTTFEQALGAEHPKLAVARVDLAIVLIQMQRHEEAQAQLELAHASLERSLGPESVDVSISLLGLGKLYEARGELERARAVYERALRIREKTLDPGHPGVAESLYQLGTIHERWGAFEQARELYECALEIRTVAEVSAFDLAESRFALARVIDDPERARQFVEQARADYAAHSDEALADVDAWLLAHPP